MVSFECSLNTVQVAYLSISVILRTYCIELFIHKESQNFMLIVMNKSPHTGSEPQASEHETGEGSYPVKYPTSLHKCKTVIPILCC